MNEDQTDRATELIEGVPTELVRRVPTELARRVPTELWIRLMCLQADRGHFLWRSTLAPVVKTCADWAEFRERAEALGAPVEKWRRDSPLKEDGLRRDVDLFLREDESALLLWGRVGYPDALNETPDPPWTLSRRGPAAALLQPSLSVVGSREASPESLEWMETELAAFCRAHEIGIVSGGARGVDQKAHSVALRARRPTVFVLPSGLSDPYPGELKGWNALVRERGGCFLSEYPPRHPMHKKNFAHRNRLIAGLGRMTLIVEARRRSGTWLTAERAAEIGRPLLVIPGHPQNPRFAGSLELLSQGALLVRQAEDLTLLWQAESTPFDGQGVWVDDATDCDP